MKQTTFNDNLQRHTLMKALGITALMLLLLVSSAGASPFAYVPTCDGGYNNFISVIDTATNKITSNVTIGVGNTCLGVAVNPTGTRVYITNEGSYPNYDGTIDVIDTANNKVTATINVGKGPYGVAVNPAGTRIYVANSGTNKVSVIDTATNKVLATVPVGDNPKGVAVTPDGKLVYVTNFESHSISVINTATNTVAATVKLPDSDSGWRPAGVAVSPDGKKVYATTPHDVWVINTATINTATNSKISDIHCNTSYLDIEFTAVAVSPDGKKVYVTNDIGDIFVVDTAKNKIITRINDGQASSNPFGINGVAVTPDGKKAYVTASKENSISVINTATNTITTNVNEDAIFAAFGQFIGPKITHPVAAFTATPLSGKAPLTVKFTDKSMGSQGDYLWTLGTTTLGKITSTDRNPVYTYTKPGIYTISLKVTNAAGSNIKTISNYITVA